MTAPDRMCAPISEPFSRMHTETSRLLLCRELLQADRGGEPRRAAADDHDVVFHRFARHAVSPSGVRIASLITQWHAVVAEDRAGTDSPIILALSIPIAGRRPSRDPVVTASAHPRPHVARSRSAGATWTCSAT